jgi:hypothetical protein
VVAEGMRGNMAGRKVATTIYITVDQDRQLKLLSQSTGTSMAQYIREGIDMVLEQHRAELPHQLGLGFGDEEEV